MPNLNLDALLNPAAIAVVGASPSNSNGVGSRALHQLRRFAGRPIFMVHPRANPDDDPMSVVSVDALPESIDLLIVAVPAAHVVDVIRAGATKGIPAALIFTSGFAEGGAEGAAAQQELREISAQTGMLINGPNTIGFLNLHERLLATFYLPADCELPTPGPVAFVSQSGALATYIDDLARDRGINAGWLVTTGNESVVRLTDVLEYLVERPEVRVLAGTSEGLTDVDAFVRVAAKAAELGKPFVFVKAGSSPAGMTAVMSHTASISGADEVFDAVCQQYGVLRAASLEEALDWVAMLQPGRSAGSGRVALLSGSGGAGVLMADAADAAGLEVLPTPEQDRKVIDELIPSFGSSANPIDMTAQAIASGVESYQRILDAIFASDAFDSVVIASGLRGAQSIDVAHAIAASYASTTKTLAVGWYSLNAESREVLVRAGIPTYPDMSRAVNAVAALRRFEDERSSVTPEPATRVDKARRVRALAILSEADVSTALTEEQSKSLLSLYEIPVVQERGVASVDDAVAMAEQMASYPVVVKVLSAELPHKSDVGGVKVGLADADAVRRAGEEILTAVAQHRPDAVIDGLLVQQMAPPGVELVFGAHRDPVFGPTVTVGLGGVLVEVIAEVALRKAPLTIEQARAAITGLSGGRLVSHARGVDRNQVDELAGVLVRVGDLMVEVDQISEIDINPVIVSAAGPLVADALIVRGTE
ncbi:acetate--CoA ligase family protein [Microbacterium profundi]|uniref:Acetate--CoA ligase family protein n=1 Tax=Microbacterium profundi TaxID=450380 RepID=A0ABV3LES1_9MICO